MSEGLHGRIVHGAVWAFASSWAQLAVSLVAFALIARWIGPVGFGQSTMVGALVALPQVLVSQAAGEVLVQRQNPDRAVETAWLWVVAGSGLLLSLLLLALRRPIAALYGEPIVADLLLGSAWIPLLASLQCVPEACLARGMHFRLQALAGGCGAILGGLSGIFAAWRGAGPWAMVCMQLVQAATACAIILLGSGWRPQARPALAALPDMLRYARSSLGVRLLNEVDSQFPKLVTGVLLGPAALGLLAVSIRVFDILKNLLITPMNSVALPAISRARASGADLRKLFESALRLATGVANPAFCGLIAVAPLMVVVLFGKEWVAAAPVLQIVALLGLRSAVSSFNGAALRGCDRPDLQLRLGLFGTALTVLLIPPATALGALGVAVAMVLRGYVVWPIAAWLVQKLGVFPAARQFTLGLPTLTLSMAMAAVVLAIQPWLRGVVGEVPLLVGCVLLGAVLYGLGVLLFIPRELTDLKRLLRQFRSAGVAPKAPAPPNSATPPAAPPTSTPVAPPPPAG